MEAWLLGQATNLYCIFILLLLSICFLLNFYYVKCKGNLHDIAHFYILLKVIFDETLQQFLDSYLQFAPRYWKDLFSLNSFCCSCVKETLHICYVVIQTLFYHLESLKLGLVYLSKVCETNPLLFYVRGFHIKQFALTSCSPR